MVVFLTPSPVHSQQQITPKVEMLIIFIAQTIAIRQSLLPWLATANQPVGGGDNTSPTNDECHCELLPAEPAEQGADATDQQRAPTNQSSFAISTAQTTASILCIKYIRIYGCTTKKLMILLFGGREALPR